MATSPEAFQKVKQILQKLDRSIDSARDRRLSGSPSPAGAGSAQPQKVDSTVSQGTPESGPLRARPMRTPDHHPQPSWNASTGTNGHAGR